MTVIGCGHLGATHAAAMAEIGHDVIGVDIDPGKIDTLSSGRAWFREPELDDLLTRHVGGRLRFTTDIRAAAAHGEIHFIGVGTPALPDGSGYDLSQVFGAVEALAPHLDDRCLIVGKSTVAVGTTEAVAARVRELSPAGKEVEVAWSPEFLREGHAVADTLRPDRIVAGVTSAWAEKMIREAFAPIVDHGVPIIVTDPATCELVKGAANAFLATKISFINAVANLCEATGADAATVARAIGYDERIGPRAMVPGLGYGGGCLPKDVRAFIARADAVGEGDSFNFLRAVDLINQLRRTRVVRKVYAATKSETVQSKRVAVWGASFKPGTDDIRDSPALDVANQLHEAGAQVRVYDPMATENARAAYPDLALREQRAGRCHRCRRSGTGYRVAAVPRRQPEQHWGGRRRAGTDRCAKHDRRGPVGGRRLDGSPARQGLTGPAWQCPAPANRCGALPGGQPRQPMIRAAVAVASNRPDGSTVSKAVRTTSTVPDKRRLGHLSRPGTAG